jgi:O-antigen/teichoic acid export membrane protein
MADHPTQPAASGSERFVANVIWSWLGMLSNIAAAFLLTPYMLRSLGDQRYGMWSLTYSLIDYCWLLEMGFRSATINFVAFYHAKSDQETLNSVISTSLVYFTGVGILVGLLSFALAPVIPGFFQVPPALLPEFRSLLILVGMSWGLGAVFLVFQASLEGIQRFDVVNRIAIGTNFLRLAAWTVVLASGHGTLALVSVYIVVQLGSYGFHLWFLKRILRGLRLSVSYFSRAWLKKLNGYGMHSFLAIMSHQTLTQTPPLVIGHFLPVAFVGYYNVANRLISSTVSELVNRVGLVSSPKSAELAAKGELAGAGQLTLYANRYCLLVILPLCIMFAVFGRDMLTLWIGVDRAVRTMPLLVPILLGSAVVASQFNSSAVLFGVAGHQGYAKGFAAEAVIGVVAMVAVAPHFGAAGIAWVVAITGTLNRGLLTSWLVCRRLGISWGHFMASIYVRPLAVGAAVFALAWLIRAETGDHRRLILLLAIGALIVVVYAALCLALCVPEEHRAIIFQQLSKLRERFRGIPAAETRA